MPDSPRSKEELQRLLCELQLHQIELELQNAELQHARDEMNKLLGRYTDLYDFAPVGYLTPDRKGVIQAANLTAAGLLGIERARLVGRRFALFVATEARRFFSDFLVTVFSSQGKESGEMLLSGEGSSPLFVQIEAIALEGGEECRIAFIDMTARMRAEEALRVSNEQITRFNEKARYLLEVRVRERTAELSRVNERLTQEVGERKRAEESLLVAYAEIKGLKDRLHAENIYLRQEVAQEQNFGDIIGKSTAISHVFLRIKQVAPMNATVLLLGETGVGKGVVARAIQSRSVRKERPMITVNCASLPVNLIESELFGRERGAYTGAHERQMGRFELADGGTIFLDEIGEIPLELQAKLLRVIQDGEFERLGSPHTVKVDVRIIAASNRNLEDEIRAGRFREDLFYRLNVFPIVIPPLRQRPEDIPLFITHFVLKFSKKIGKKIDTVSAETMDTLQRYHWPGNVRELENIIERAVIISQGSALHVADRFDPIFKWGIPGGENVTALAELEQDHILLMLQKTGWRIEGKNGAALLLGLNPSTLRSRMRKHGIHFR